VLADGGYRWGTPLAPTDPLYGRAIASFFAAIVLCQVANVFVFRTTRQSVFTKGLFRNRGVLVGIALELLLLTIIVASPVGHAVFGTATPPVVGWLLPLPFAALMLALSELIKAARRRRETDDQRVESP